MARTPPPARTTRARRPSGSRARAPRPALRRGSASSVDQVAAQSLRPRHAAAVARALARGRRLERRLGPVGRVPQYDRVAHADGAAADGGESADRVRAAVRRRRTAEQRAQRRAQAASLLDSVLDGRGALGRTLPGDDRARLERHLEDVREVERRIELAGRRSATTSRCRRSPPAFPTTSSSMRSSCSICSRWRGPRTSRASAR